MKVFDDEKGILSNDYNGKPSITQRIQCFSTLEFAPDIELIVNFSLLLPYALLYSALSDWPAQVREYKSLLDLTGTGKG